MPREGRLAEARNIGLRELHRLPPTEYVIVVDLDVLGWDPHGVADSFFRQHVGNDWDDWDVVCANGILLYGLYRDTYAFRTDRLNTNHHWAGNDHAIYNITLAQKKEHRKNLRDAQAQVRSVNDFPGSVNGMLRVSSCFGGLAIYRSVCSCIHSMG
jgi:hypothetical protein